MNFSLKGIKEIRANAEVTLNRAIQVRFQETRGMKKFSLNHIEVFSHR